MACRACRGKFGLRYCERSHISLSLSVERGAIRPDAVQPKFCCRLPRLVTRRRIPVKWLPPVWPDRGSIAGLKHSSIRALRETFRPASLCRGGQLRMSVGVNLTDSQGWRTVAVNFPSALSVAFSARNFSSSTDSFLGSSTVVFLCGLVGRVGIVFELCVRLDGFADLLHLLSLGSIDSSSRIARMGARNPPANASSALPSYSASIRGRHVAVFDQVPLPCRLADRQILQRFQHFS